MKNSIFTFILLLASISAFSQDNLRISYANQGITSDVCPSTPNPYWYNASKNNDNLSGCTFTYNITNGVILGAAQNTPTTISGLAIQLP